ncbi:hypothetical protein DL764_001583 [Monosporascus ibericus]|uniref:Uncharacterized protein n=1 Tax=Monosporascus ibericus TaxID=155417 RepID=A0A4Q4TTK5_9PEZI|nr:hypothetical protein DL764_001583 [Monosporascus ibericus]
MGDYTIQKEASRILHEVLLKDDRLGIPDQVKDVASRIVFDESAVRTPFLPAPVKCTESSTALWALLAAFGSAIAKQRYGLQQKAVVNSDVATMFLFSFLFLTVGGKPTSDPETIKRYGIYDTKQQMTPWRRLTTTVYPTKDGRYFHLHGGMDSTKSLLMLGLPSHESLLDEMEVIKRISERVQRFDANWLDIEANEHWRQAGGICLTPEEFQASEQGEAIANDGLYLIEESSRDRLPPVPWPDVKTATFRPLEGIKFVDITRAIAGPTIARLAALFGATVVRVSNTELPDLGIVLFESNLGKRDADVDLKTEEGRRALLNLIEDADVVLDGYRPGVLERLGFGPAIVHAVAEKRGMGIVYARENCHGWKGPWRHRSGWQQVSDAVTGIGWLFGQMWGLDEPVMPFLPNSDFQTGIVGCVAIMNALDRRARSGGSYLVSTSLNQLNRFLISLGTHCQETQRALRERWPDMKFRYYDDLHRQMPVLRASLPKRVPELLNPKYFMTLKAELGVPEETMTFVGPVVSYETTKLFYNRGSCLRGTDKPEWPDE